MSKKTQNSSKSFQRKICNIIALTGCLLLVLSLCIKEDWASVLSGLGTGAITSLLVTLLINTAAERRSAEEKAIDRKIVLHDVMYAAQDIYCDLLYRINEYIIFSKSDIKTIYGIYDNSEQLKVFIEYLKAINFDNLSEDDKKRLNALFNFGSYRIDRLVSEIKHLPKQTYYLYRIMTEDEVNTILSNQFVDKYSEYATDINEFWRDEIIDYQKCIVYFKLTINCCCRIISAFKECKNQVSISEKNIKDVIDEIYYREIYCNSDEYIEQEISRAEAEQDYYENHPELLAELEAQYEQWENETPTDIVIREMECLFFGFSSNSFDELLKKADKDSPTLISFFRRKDILKKIKKREYKKTLCQAYGDNYYKRIIKEDTNNG